MRYLLDTNILSYLEERNSPFHLSVKQHMSACSSMDELFISSLTIYELYYSVACAGEKDQVRVNKLIGSYLRRFQVFPLQLEGAVIFGQLKQLLRTKTALNTKVLDRHNVDLMIASCAILQQAILVSNDRIFETLAQHDNRLKFENWAAPD